MKEQPLKYEIAVSFDRQLIVVYPSWKGPRSGTTIIGIYQPENARSNLFQYSKQLEAAIQERLLTINAPSYDTFRVMVTRLEGGPEVMLKEAGTTNR